MFGMESKKHELISNELNFHFQMIRLCCEVSVINNFQGKSCSVTCLIGRLTVKTFSDSMHICAFYNGFSASIDANSLYASRRIELTTQRRPLCWRSWRTFFLAVDAGDVSALVLLDLSAALDTVDHGILRLRLLINVPLSLFISHAQFPR